MPKRKYVMDIPDNWLQLAALEELKERVWRQWLRSRASSTASASNISAGASSSEATPGSDGGGGEAK